jgi:hypothetical protein
VILAVAIVLGWISGSFYTGLAGALALFVVLFLASHFIAGWLEWQTGRRFAAPKGLVMTTRRIMEEGRPILLVTHGEDPRAWRFLNSEDDLVDAAKGVAVHVQRIIERDPSVAAVADLLPGWHARRSSEGAPWNRAPAEPQGSAARQIRSISTSPVEDGRRMRPRRREQTPIGRVRAAKAAGDVEYLIGVLRQSGDMPARYWAATSLGRMGDRRAVKPLIRTLDASDVVLRNSAVKALARIGDPSAAPALFELATSSDSPGVRITAMSALGDLGDRRAGQLIVQLLTDDDVAKSTLQSDRFPRVPLRRTRKWAARRLVELDAREVVPELRVALSRVGRRERFRIRRLIRRLGE